MKATLRGGRHDGRELDVDDDTRTLTLDDGEPSTYYRLGDTDQFLAQELRKGFDEDAPMTFREWE